MKPTSERGVALVITLIMLALVTFMAVVFLAISRREKASVAVMADIVNARLMADAALARAQSELASRMFTSTNPFDYDLIVSTNRDGINVPANASLQNRALALSTLQYDARPPVYVPTDQTGRTNDFRYWLDLNRNGLFEPTGLSTNVNQSSEKLEASFNVGDPQWIGVLERPDRPHSESNRFIGRYIYMILPAGKSLDLNAAHNNAKRIRNDMSQDGFYRNQGVGSWELNLAAFFAGLNTNAGAWGPLNTTYNYSTSLGIPNSGAAFEDASTILKHRYERDLTKLASARAFFNFPPSPNNPFATNGIDYYSDGPLTGPLLADNVNLAWSGSYNPNGYYDIQELFDPNKTSTNFVHRLTNNATRASLYDRYTYYRLLAQLGTDSRPQDSNKLYFADFQLHPTNRMHLYYKNLTPNAQTNFVAWEPLTFFTNAADRMLRASLEPLVLTNGSRRGTNFMIGLTPVRNTFCCTNIQLHHVDAGKVLNPAVPFYVTNNEYSSAVHRMLQVAANIHDATTVRHLGTTNDYPSVFRPLFLRTATNLTIRGFVEETNTVFLDHPWMTIEQAAATLAPNTVISNINLYGVPLVIGAKKGYPTFNKLVVQTVADISRRLEVRKATPLGLPIETNQMYVVGISNRFGVEGWNSYTQNFNRSLELRVAGQATFALHHRPEGTGVEYQPAVTSWVYSATTTLASWPGMSDLARSFVVPVDTNITSLANSIYLTRTGTLRPFNTNIFEKSFRVPQWALRLTNRLQYILIDRSAKPQRVIDYVSLDNLVSDVDLRRGMTGDTNAAGGGIFSDKNQTGGQTGRNGPVTDGDMWNGRRVGAGLDTPTLGTINQINVSKGAPYVGEGTWRSSTGQTGEKESAIRQFTEFMSGRLTNLVWQVPFTPSRRLYQRTSWEANDPLVHYTAEDLTEPVVSTNLLVRPIAFTFPFAKDAMLREISPRYRPWGGNPSKDPSNDQTAYALTMKDPLIRRSDDWHFPNSLFPNIGWLGRVHRGTPWQTIYLKSAVDPRTGQALDIKSWGTWSGSYGTHPTNDWKLLDLFTVAANDNASRGLLSVNQTNMASWSAVLSGVPVLTNTTPDSATGPGRLPQYAISYVQPTSPQMLYMVEGINRTRAQLTNRVYRTIGEVLAAPELTVRSPYLNWASKRQYEQGIDDAAYERIPQQIMSLLRTDEPRVVIYAFGQSLKPAERSLVTVSTLTPPIFNLCTNYQVTGEFAAKTVLRLEDMTPQAISRDTTVPAAQRMRAVLESYTVLQPE